MNMDHIYYAGSHGFEIRGPSDVHIQRVGDSYLEGLRGFRDRVSARLQDIEGSSVEDNVYSISVHYRNVPIPEDVEKLTKIVDEEIAKSDGQLCRKSGKMVYEARPAMDWHKGKAVSVMLSHVYPKMEEDIVPIYLGDDITDEDAFDFISSHKNGNTHARSVVRNALSFA